MRGYINYVYKTFPHLGSAYCGTYGLVNALKKLGVLNYHYDINGNEFFDNQELEKYPILYMKGHTPGMMPFIEGIKQFKASINPESIWTRHGQKDPDNKLLQDRKDNFNLFFTFSESDV